MKPKHGLVVAGILVAVVGSVTVGVLNWPDADSTGAEDQHRARSDQPGASTTETRLSSERQRAFFDAASAGDMAQVKRLLADHPGLIATRPHDDTRTPLIAAVWSGHADMVRVLLEHGADIEAEDHEWGASALGWCAWFGRPEAAAVLIEAGADVNHPNRDGVGPLGSAYYALEHVNKGSSHATREGVEAVIKLLEAEDAVRKTPRTRPWPPVGRDKI